MGLLLTLLLFRLSVVKIHMITAHVRLGLLLAEIATLDLLGLPIRSIQRHFPAENPHGAIDDPEVLDRVGLSTE